MKPPFESNCNTSLDYTKKLYEILSKYSIKVCYKLSNICDNNPVRNMRGACMFEFLNEVKDSIKEIDELTAKNKFMSNPFNKVVNQTFVWTEKPSVFEKMLKK